MQPQPLVRIQGIVLGSRVVKFPARTWDGGSSAAGSFREVDVQSSFASYDGKVTDLGSVLTLSGREDNPHLTVADGSAIDLLCTVGTVWRRRRRMVAGELIEGDGKSYQATQLTPVGPTPVEALGKRALAPAV